MSSEEIRDISIRDILHEVISTEQEKHLQKEVAKRGVLRAGNTGIVLQDTGETAGSCQRVAHLRSALGIQLEAPTDANLLMWDGGIWNESYWLEKLKLHYGAERLKCEEEIPIKWNLPDGTPVSGRPDIVILNQDMQSPMLGLELKKICSVWTARDVSFDRGIPKGPKLAHLCQAAHYSKVLGGDAGPLPYKIIYTNYDNFASPLSFASAGTKEKMEKVMFPRPGEPGSENCEYNDAGWLKNVKPHHTIYDIAWDGDHVLYREEGAHGEWTSTPVTWSGIVAYYQSVVNVPKDLGPRPKTLSAVGTKLNYTTCGYCPAKDVCDTHEKKGYNQWLQAIRRLGSGIKK